jgi:hypothetical protein
VTVGPDFSATGSDVSSLGTAAKAGFVVLVDLEVFEAMDQHPFTKHLRKISPNLETMLWPKRVNPKRKLRRNFAKFYTSPHICRIWTAKR